jgi:hypothetical protein
VKYIYSENSLDEVFIENKSAKKSIVVLLPVTRIGEKNIDNWEKILHVIQRSEVVALVVLDKTPSAEATDFFSKRADLLKSDIYLIRRTPGEAIYDSQSVVTIDENLWILQLHDDDEWDGVLAFPFEPNRKQLFSPNFVFAGKQETNVLSWEASPPARINFTALPSEVWNRFTLFIRSQGGHAAGSVDSTLNLMSRLICHFVAMDSFDYRYDNRHWKNQKQAKGNLEKLALEDGWENLASEEIQLLNRRIDALCAFIFFQDLLPGKFDNIRQSLLHDFKLSPKKKLHLRVRMSVFFLYKEINNLSMIKSVAFSDSKKQSRIRNQIEIDMITLQSTKIQSGQDILRLVKKFQSLGNFPKLKERFAFWERTFQ